MKPADNTQVALKKYSLFDAVELNPSSLEIVQKEIGESPESRKRCLQVLRKCLTESKDDLRPCLEEEFLLWFLRVAKFNCTKALERIQRYYSSQERYLNAFKHHTMSITEAQMYRYITASPYRMENNSALIVSKIAFVDYSRLAMLSKIYLDTIVANKVLSNPVTQMCGVNLIIDLGGFTLETLMAHTLGRFHLMLDMLLVYIHPNNDNWKCLHSYFPREILPEDFGGHLKQSSMIDLLENVEDLEMSFRERLKYGFKATEKLRSTWSGIAL